MLAPLLALLVACSGGTSSHVADTSSVADSAPMAYTDALLGDPCAEEGTLVCGDDAEGGQCCVRCTDGVWVADPPQDTADPINSNCPSM